jgi:hypothetical protein
MINILDIGIVSQEKKRIGLKQFQITSFFSKSKMKVFSTKFL